MSPLMFSATLYDFAENLLPFYALPPFVNFLAQERANIINANESLTI